MAFEGLVGEPEGLEEEFQGFDVPEVVVEGLVVPAYVLEGFDGPADVLGGLEGGLVLEGLDGGLVLDGFEVGLVLDGLEGGLELVEGLLPNGGLEAVVAAVGLICDSVTLETLSVVVERMTGLRVPSGRKTVVPMPSSLMSLLSRGGARSRRSSGSGTLQQLPK